MIVSPLQLIAFSVASFVLLTMPGPTIILVISKSLSHGARHTLALLAGIGLGDLVAMSASLLGLGALLAESSRVFLVLKVMGAIYLIVLGFKMWRDAPRHLQTIEEKTAGTDKKAFLTAFTVTTFNPKSIVFFIAFVPQFINSNRDIHVQMIAFIGIFVAISLGVSAVYAVSAIILKRKIKMPSMQYHANRAGGGVLAASGLGSLVIEAVHG